jgi:hypothetical protein
LVIARDFRVRKQNEHNLSLVHRRHPRLFIDLDIIRPHRGGWAITNTDGDRASSAERVVAAASE